MRGIGKEKPLWFAHMKFLHGRRKTRRDKVRATDLRAFLPDTNSRTPPANTPPWYASSHHTKYWYIRKAPLRSQTSVARTCLPSSESRRIPRAFATAVRRIHRGNKRSEFRPAKPPHLAGNLPLLRIVGSVSADDCIRLAAKHFEDTLSTCQIFRDVRETQTFPYIPLCTCYVKIEQQPTHAPWKIKIGYD
jgi:hypothetical protein